MNDFLFYALLVALLYYFFIYLPSQKKSISNQSLTKPLTQTQFTQTEPDPINKNDELNGPEAIPDPQIIQKLQKDIHQKETTIIGLNNSYNKLETQKNKTIDNLKTQLKEKDNQIKELKALENQVDNLTKNIQDLQKEIAD